VRACSGFTWRVSDCEELVGLLTGDDGAVLNICILSITYKAHKRVVETRGYSIVSKAGEEVLKVSLRMADGLKIDFVFSKAFLS